MADFHPYIITDNGRALIARVGANEGEELVFTKFQVSDSEIDIENNGPTIERLPNVNQSVNVDGVIYQPPDMAKVTGLVTSLGLTQGYYVKTIALWAKSSKDTSDILFAITTQKNYNRSDWMSAEGSQNSSSILISSNIIVANAKITSVTITPDGTVSQEAFDDFKNAITAEITSHKQENAQDFEDVRTNITQASDKITEVDGKVNGLQNNIDTEKARITQEITDRTQADTNLQQQINNLSSTKQNKLTAGTNVEITEDNVINVKGDMLNSYILSPRNLKQVLEATSVKDAFAKLRAKTSVGDFSNLRLGDYIDLETFYDGEQTYAWNEEHKNLRLVIVAFNHYYKIGDTEVTQQHAVMQFLNCYRQKRMHSTDSNAGGYPGKELQLFLNGTFKTGIVNAIGIEPLTIRRLLDNKSNWSWTAEQCFLPTEVEVWGHQAWSNNEGYSTGTSIQYPYYSIAPQNRIKLYNGNRQWWWVASPVSSNTAGFANVNLDGGDLYGVASSTTGGVAPAFCI